MNCPFCVDDHIEMIEGVASTNEIENGHHLTCKSCGFSMTAKSKIRLELAHEILFNCYPDQEAV